MFYSLVHIGIHNGPKPGSDCQSGQNQGSYLNIQVRSFSWEEQVPIGFL